MSHAARERERKRARESERREGGKEEEGERRVERDQTYIAGWATMVSGLYTLAGWFSTVAMDQEVSGSIYR